MGEITLLLGGARSGKSALAVEIGARAAGEVVFLATAERLDDDMSARIERHRRERPAWPTVEEPLEIAAALRTRIDDGSLVIVDCLTVWLGTVMHLDPGSEDRRAADLVDALRERSGAAVVISNEVGMGVHPETELGRSYRDALGRANQMVAAAAGTTLLLVAGQALRLHDPWGLL